MELQDEMATVMSENQQLLEERPESGDEVWAQRYQELLENYKLLQEEMGNKQPDQNPRNPMVGRENESEMSKKYRDLNMEYTKIFNEFKDLKRRENQEKSEKQ